MRDMKKLEDMTKQTDETALEARMMSIYAATMKLNGNVMKLKRKLPPSKSAALEGLLTSAERSAASLLEFLQKKKGANLTPRQLDQTLNSLASALAEGNKIIDQSGIGERIDQ